MAGLAKIIKGKNKLYYGILKEFILFSVYGVALEILRETCELLYIKGLFEGVINKVRINGIR